MSNDLVKNKIYLDKSIANKKAQVLIEGDIIVSDTKPDIANILQTSANFVIDKNEILNGKISMAGKLNLNVLYTTKDNESVYNIDHCSKINDYINVDNLEKEMLLDLKPNINKIDYKILNDRKINFRAIIDLEVSVSKEEELEIITAIKEIPDTQLLKQKINLNRFADSRFDRFIIKDEFNLDSNKPNILEILKIDTEIISKDIKVFDGKVNSTGEIILKIIYKPDISDSIIESAEHKIDFNGVFDVPKAKEFMQADLKLFVQEQNIDIKTNQDGEDRLLDCEIFVGANIKLLSNQELEILKDVYEINKKINLIQEDIEYQDIICKTKSQVNLKELIELNKSLPEIFNIVKINAVPYLDDIHVIPDKLILDGFIELDILYLTQNNENKIYNYKTAISFKQTLETAGSLPDMIYSADLSIEKINFNNINNYEVEVRLLANLNAYIIDSLNLKIIKNVEITDFEKEDLEKFSSITLYTIQDDDKLWEIAKKYNTSIDRLKEINDITDDIIKSGQKLLIIK
ncbi:MAG: DUF3794 domain-containing protein [Clostridiales bacterium]|jgi:LysM repeat protein|nr:DUF3794 domain-containing protein [Clostridiales bacterium]